MALAWHHDEPFVSEAPFAVGAAPASDDGALADGAALAPPPAEPTWLVAPAAEGLVPAVSAAGAGVPEPALVAPTPVPSSGSEESPQAARLTDKHAAVIDDQVARRRSCFLMVLLSSSVSG
jgi:hypothetical protein